MFAVRSYLLDVSRRMPTLRTLQELVDLLARLGYNEFLLLRDASAGFEEALAEETPPRLKAYCEMQGIALAELSAADFDALVLMGESVAVSTEAPRSLAGRVEEMRERMIVAEASARANRARRFLVTDLSDGCMWQPLAVSLPGIVMGGFFATGGAKSSRMDLERELDAALGAPVGGMLLKLGTLYLRGGARRDDASEFFNILSHDNGYSRHPGLTTQVLEEVGGIARGVRVAAERWTDRSDWAKEIVYAANLLDAACHRRDERRLRELRDEHGRVWRMRFAPGGRVDSLSRLPRF